MDRFCLRSAALAGLAAVIALALPAPLAQAAEAITSSSITTPANPSFLMRQAGEKLKVSGTVVRKGAVKEAVNINCYYETPLGEIEEELVAGPVAVAYSGTTGTFSAEPELTLTELEGEHACTLRAVPEEEEFELEAAALAPFSGPRLGVAELTPSKIASGPNKEKTYDFSALSSQLSGYGEYESFSGGGVSEAEPFNPNTFEAGASLLAGNDGYPGSRGAGSTRSYLQVDGANAYGSTAAYEILATAVPSSSEFAGFPELTVSDEYDHATGDLTIHESQPLVKCNSEPTYPPQAGVCTEFVSTGVTVDRTIVQNEGGRQATVSDKYLSTDGMSHTVNLISLEDADEVKAGYDFPWVGGGAYEEHKAGEVLPGAPAAPANVFMSFNNTLADGSEKGAQGAITFSSPPSGLEFVEKGLTGNTHLTASFQRTVPAVGSLTMAQVFSWAFTRAEALALAGPAKAPEIAITAPTTGATVSTSPVTVSGVVTAGGNGLPGTVSVNGQSVPVGSGGAWSAVVPLTVGANTVTATTTDVEGETASSHIAVTYSPGETAKEKAEREAKEKAEREAQEKTEREAKEQAEAKEKGEREAKEKAERQTKEKAEREASVKAEQEAKPLPAPITVASLLPPTPIVTASATITKSSYGGNEVLLTISCNTGAMCSGEANVTAMVALTVKDKTGHRKTRSEKITVAAGSFSIAAGHSETIKLKLTRTAAKELARLGKLVATITASVNQANKTSTAVTAHLTLHKATAKKKKA